MLNNRKSKRWRQVFAGIGFVVALGFLVLITSVYYWTEDYGPSLAVTKYWHYSSDEAKNFAVKNVAKHMRLKGHKYYNQRNLSYDFMRKSDEGKFDVNGSDVIVFIHIQKTAGTTFEKALVQNLDLPQPCQCFKRKNNRRKCHCLRPGSFFDEWLFSRYSTGWQCGLHADWTELVASNCVDNVLDQRGIAQKRRYFYTTFLREPISRYVSEFRHVQRGATWRSSPHVCNGRVPGPDELPMCFDPDVGWKGVSLDVFIDCPYNLAANRQTRMLADLTLIGCYNLSIIPERATREALMLASAKRNLDSLAYFGMQEFMHKSQYVFERTFGLSFTQPMLNWNESKSDDTPMTEAQLARIRQANDLDLQLYEFARELFLRRFEQLKADDNMFDFNYAV